MTVTLELTLELTPDEEEQLRANAAQKGISVEEYFRAALHNQSQRDDQANTPRAFEVAP